VLSGVVTELRRDGTWQLAPDPRHSFNVNGTTELHVAHLHWARGATAVATPELSWHAESHGAGDQRTLESKLSLASLHLAFGDHDVDLNGVEHSVRAELSGDVADPRIELSQKLTISAVEQTVAPEYPLGALQLDMNAERAPDGVLHISQLELDNGRSGTKLALSGNVDLTEGRRTLSVTTTLAQDLARISTIPERLRAHGKLAVEASVTSPDFVRYRVRAAVKGEDVSLALPRDGISVQSANGEVPIAFGVEVGKHGLHFEHTENHNPYSMLRFADQHPLLRRSGFVSVARIDTPLVSIAPLVGNLEVEQNMISLRQFELGVRGGSVTGQCGLDWNGLNSSLELHVRAQGVKSSHGEPFDGNIAVMISGADRSVDGRAEVLRIGERHLLDLLDLQDPLRVDPAMNRVRSALDFGYPKRMRLVFDHGFASAHIELGGLAQFVSISELRGIPMGPIVDNMLARMLQGRELKEMP
jgi:hypothetical protein